MRIRISIDAKPLAKARARAAASGLTLAAVIEDALRATFARPTTVDRRVVAAALPSRRPLPVFHGSRLVSGVDLDHGAALLERMEGGVLSSRWRHPLAEA